MFKAKVISRHPSHKGLSNDLPRFRQRVAIRFGSWRKPTPQGVTITVNTDEAVRNAANKLLMKQKFTEHGVVTASWWTLLDFCNLPANQQVFPIVAKNVMGSRGHGVYLIKSMEELERWIAKPERNGQQYIVEKYIPYSREYRLHVTKDGCFYTCRKAMKRDTPENIRWKFNSEQTVWLLETNPEFHKPQNWNRMVEESVKALNAVGLDVGGVDVKVSAERTNAGNQRFFVLEINSAPSFAEMTREKYIETLTTIINHKHEHGNA